MAQFILKENGKVVPHCSPKPLRVEEIRSATEQNKCKVFGGLIKERW